MASGRGTLRITLREWQGSWKIGMPSVGGDKSRRHEPAEYNHGIMKTLDKRNGIKTTTAVITKRDKPVVTPVPAEKDADEICGFVAGKGAVNGDVVSPAISRRHWGELK